MRAILVGFNECSQENNEQQISKKCFMQNDAVFYINQPNKQVNL